jgi:CPA2 family monovalent cation:H+ antiporter-2
MQLVPLIQDLAVILALAAGVAMIFHRFRQPVVVGYILAGVLVGPHSPFPSPIFDLPNIHTWGEIGVVFLMFHLGLEFSFRRFERLGIRAGLVGLGETTIMFILGAVIAHLSGFGEKDAMFIGAMIAISSTTIIVKAFDELGLKTRRFAESVLGVLIVEDLIAVLLIVILNSFTLTGTVEGSMILSLLGELLIVIGGWFIVGAFLVPRFVARVGKSQNQELLTLLAVGLCLALAVTAAHFQYSMALGAFIMGSIISETREAEKIRRLVHPLRDLFAAVFFVSVGMLVDLRAVLNHPGLVILLAMAVVLGKFAALLSMSLLSGQPFRHSVRVAMSMGQVGEFSFIIATLGITSKAMSSELQPVIVSVSLITSFITPYLIRSSDRASHFLYDRLPLNVRGRIEAYTLMLASRSETEILPHWLKPGLARLLINALVVAIVFTVSRRFVTPFLGNRIADPLLSQAASLFVAIALAAPFLFAMLNAARRAVAQPGEHETVRDANLRAFFFFLFTILWLGGLSSQYLSISASAAITVTLAGVLFLLFKRRLEFSYAWIERRFLAGLDNEAEETTTQKAMRELAPWDAHLVKLVVNPTSKIAGLTLLEAALRRDHGINVIALRRGDLVIPMPESTEILYPCDELLVLGTDEQIESVRPELENPSHDGHPHEDLAEYDMQVLRITEHSPLSGHTLLSSRLREEHGCLVVGVEREALRNMNPPPDFRIRAGDLLWIVGERHRLRALL